jgi:hypothetical protein
MTLCSVEQEYEIEDDEKTHSESSRVEEHQKLSSGAGRISKHCVVVVQAGGQAKSLVGWANSLSNFMHLQRMEVGTRLRRAIGQRGHVLADWIIGGTEEARTRRGRAHGRLRGGCGCWVHCWDAARRDSTCLGDDLWREAVRRGQQTADMAAVETMVL